MSIIQSKRKIIITGAAGFLGSYVAKKASSHGFYVVGIGHGKPDDDLVSKSGIDEWHQSDINLDILKMHGAGVESIIHCAGGGSVAYSLEEPYLDFQKTVVSSISIFEYARKYDNKIKIIIPSSAAVYGKASNLPIKITADTNPISPYGVNKVLVEKIAQTYASQYGLQLAIIRFFSIYGSGLKKQLWWDVCNKLTAGNLIFNGNGDETRDWIHVDDAANLLLVALDHASYQCPIVNGGNGKAVENKEIIEKIANELNGTKEVTFTGENRVGDPINYQADILESLKWGWKSEKNIDSEIISYVSWFKSEQK